MTTRPPAAAKSAKRCVSSALSMITVGNMTVLYELQSYFRGTMSARVPALRNARYQSRTSCQWLSFMLGRVSERVAHSDSALNRIAVSESSSFGALHASVTESFQRCTQFAYLTEQFGIFARMGHERGVEGFGTECGGTPLEEVDGVGAHGHVRDGVSYGFALALACVERLPLYGRSGVFHHIPWLAEREGIHQSVGAEQFVDMRFALVEVVVVRHEIHFVGPVSIIHAALVGGNHEVCGERLVGADFGDCVTFGLVEVKQHVVAETFEIKLLTGVHHGIGTHEAGDEHFVESVHFLTPEGSAPCLVEVFDGAVFTFAPQAECVERVVRVVITVVPAVFVAHMPCGDVRVGAVAFGQLAAQGERIFLEYRACWTPGLAGSSIE